MSTRSFLWKVFTGQDLPEYMQPAPEPASFSDSAKGMSDADVRRIVSDLVDEYYLNDRTKISDIPTPILRDALYGAQNSNGGLFFNEWTRKQNLPGAITRRLRMQAYEPGKVFTPTGVDMYRIQNPDMIVMPYAKSYNDEWGM